MSITIWNLVVYDPKTNIIVTNIFFLSRNDAKRYGKKKEEEWAQEGWTWALGGEPLFLGRIKD